ncbi:hypothetical protein NLJ89_g10235 [Agrocybe chaxingu]|uniref:Uncharacterized protein n=1 Tax=Agrocybe chaxingu TaxID=84603 RepID=A0A9W8JP87_9AGAR|nr:hypothetical protein NLJ89_g10235 [Agrocybe chaxingu]
MLGRQASRFSTSPPTLLDVRRDLGFAHTNSLDGPGLKLLAFDNEPAAQLYVLEEDGVMSKFRGYDGELMGEFRLAQQIGNAAVNRQVSLCVVDNIRDGIDVYETSNGHLLKRLWGQGTRPTAVALADGSYAIVRGGENGQVHILARESDEILARMQHSEGGRVEKIAVNDRIDGRVLMATATSENNNIHIWKWSQMRHYGKEGVPSLFGLGLLLSVVGIVAAFALLGQGAVSQNVSAK